MKIVTFDDVKSLGVSPTNCYEWVNEMIARKQEAFLPAKTHMNMAGNIFCNVMPCLIPGLAGANWGGKSSYQISGTSTFSGQQNIAIQC